MPTDGVEDQVVPLAVLREVVAEAVEDLARAERPNELDVLRVADRRDLGLEVVDEQLDGGRPDGSRGAVDEDALGASGSAGRRQVKAIREPSGIAAASSSVSPAGLCAMTPLSRVVTYSAFAPAATPKTSSPTRNSVTAPPISSTTPANSEPNVVFLGARMPVKMRVNRYSLPRTPIASPRVTVDACTLTSTSSSFGEGRSMSATRSTSGGPYRSWTTAFIRICRWILPPRPV